MGSKSYEGEHQHHDPSIGAKPSVGAGKPRGAHFAEDGDGDYGNGDDDDDDDHANAHVGQNVMKGTAVGSGK